MADQEMQNELEALRAQVAALSQARTEEQKRGSEPAPEAPQAPASAAAAVAEAAAIDIEDHEAVQSQMEKLLKQLEHEIRDMPTITTLGVFSLGVLFGRLMR